MKYGISIMVIMFLVPNISVASNLTVPNSFTSGTPAVAAEMNENFEAVKAAIDDNFSRFENDQTISIHANAFHVPDNQVGCVEDNSNYLFMSAGSNCNAYAGVQIPSGRQIVLLSCTTLDNNTTAFAHIGVNLVRTSANDGASSDVLVTPLTQDAPTTQRIEISLGNVEPIDNDNYFYKLDVSFGTAAGGNAVRFYGCKIIHT